MVTANLLHFFPTLTKTTNTYHPTLLHSSKKIFLLKRNFQLQYQYKNVIFSKFYYLIFNPCTLSNVLIPFHTSLFKFLSIWARNSLYVNQSIELLLNVYKPIYYCHLRITFMNALLAGLRIHWLYLLQRGETHLKKGVSFFVSDGDAPVLGI